MPFNEISYKDLDLNPLTIFAERWAALSAGSESSSNAMCIAWGQLGTLWERDMHTNRLPVATVYVRQSRYTREFMEREDTFGISFFGPEHRKALGYIGSHSGRDGDKYAPAGLTPVFQDGTVYFEEAELVLICRKVYSSLLAPEDMLDRELLEFNYPEGNYHTQYVGEVVKVLERA